MIREPTFWLIIPIGFVYQGVSWSLSLWLPTFTSQVHGATALQGASAVSAMFAGLTLGRFVNSIITRLIGDANMLLVGVCGAFISLTLSLAAPSLPWMLASLVLTGLSLSSLVPTSVAVLTRLWPEASGTVSGIFMTLSSTGVLFFPWFLGLLSEAWGMRAGLGAGIVALLILVIAVFALRRSKMPL